MSTQIILLERVESLGQMGDVVSVKPGYARNFLLPQGKALRATKDNMTYFESQKKTFEAENLTKKKDAESVAKTMNTLKVLIVRNASEAGQLYGSVTSRDIADGIIEAGFKIEKSQIEINQNFKSIGLIPVNIILHPEVKVEITLNIARSVEEAKIQEKTGKALLATNEEEDPSQASVEPEETKSEFLEDSAIEAEKEQAELDAEKALDAETKATEKAEKKAAKAVAEADALASEEADKEELSENSETSEEED